MNETIAGAGTPTLDAGEPNNAVDKATPATEASATPPATPDAQQDAAPQVPESYEFQMPEGIELDKAAADEFSAIAKELKLDQGTAQKVADIGAKMAQRQAEAHAELVASWADQVKVDKEIGGDRLNENLGIARKAIDTFGTPELKELLNSTGLGNHPAVVKFALQIGKSISEDKFVTGAPKGPETDIAKKLFPSMN